MVSCQLYLKIIIVSQFLRHEGLFSKLVGYVNMRLQNYYPDSVGLTPSISTPIVNLKGLGICTSGVEQFQCSNRQCSEPIGLAVAFTGNKFRGEKTCTQAFLICHLSIT
jgi:hypothetical protein